MTTAMVAFNWILGLLLVGTTIWLYPDHSFSAIAQWALLYAAAIAAPTFWYKGARRHFKAIGLGETPQLHLIAFRPVVAGFMTLLAALSLILRR